MIRGAIEVALSTRVSGWIYSAAETLRGRTILGFIGSRCVGSGKVEIFRQDLLDAKLGDGYCGFDFEIRLAEGEHPGSLVVRLQFSDAALLQPVSRVSSADQAGEHSGPDLGAIAPSSLSWMMDRGMLEQPEYDFLKALHSAGAYERGLRVRKGGEDATRAAIDPDMIVRDLVSLFMLADVRVHRATMASVSDLAAQPARLGAGSAPVIAIWSQDRGHITLEERSHLGPRTRRAASVPEPPVAGIEYSFGPDRLLFLHWDCRFAPRGPAPACGIVVFTAAAQAETGKLRAVPVKAA